MSAAYPLELLRGRRRLVLASRSPRRSALLAMLGVPFDVVAADVDETPRRDERPADLVARLAAAKAGAVAVGRDDDVVVVGADTVVVVDGDILGKPADAGDARRMLRALSGRAHDVHTAVAVQAGVAVRTASTVTAVTFVDLSDEEIDWYVATGEPLDKAGAYGLQGAGGTFVRRVDGSVSGVLGLPLDVVVRLLSGV